jgi:MFS family permease
MVIDLVPEQEAEEEPPPLVSVPTAESHPIVPPGRVRRLGRPPRTAPVVGAPGAFAPYAWRIGQWHVQAPPALQHPPFRRYWLGQIVALMGIWTQNTAAQLVILSLTSSAFMIGVINIASAIPLLLLSLVGGVVADRLDRRRIIMTTQLMVASLSAVWALLILTDQIAYWHILVLAVVGGAVVSFDLPAGQAFVTQIVRREDLPEAIALTSASINATRSIGPALAGVLIGVLGTAVAFLTHSLALVIFVAVIASLAGMVAPVVQRAARGSGIESLRVGLRHIRHSDDLLGLVGTTALYSFFAVPGLLVLMPLFVTKTLGGGDGWVPAMTSIFGLGSLAAAITIFRASRLEAAAGKRLRLTAFGLAGGLLWIALSPNPWAAIPGVMLSGFSFEMGLIQVQTRLQQLAPDDMRGRVLSVNGLAFNGVMPFSTLSISAASTVLGLPVVLGGCAVALALGAMALWKRYTWKAFVPEPMS